MTLEHDFFYIYNFCLLEHKGDNSGLLHINFDELLRSKPDLEIIRPDTYD